MAAVLFQQSQPALFEFAFPFLRRRGSCSSGAFLLDHHHVQLTFQQVDFSLRQFLTSKVIESCWQHYFDREQKNKIKCKPVLVSSNVLREAFVGA